MEKDQVINFWKSLDDSNNTEETITKFKNKIGYDGDRTLLRWAQAHNGFRKGLSLQEVAKITGWRVKRIEKIYGWWNSAFDPIDPVEPKGKFAEEWEHYDKIVEAMIGLQYASLEQRQKLLDEIQRERIILVDAELQKTLTKFIDAIGECTKLGMTVDPKSVTLTIDITNERMNKRYKR